MERQLLRNLMQAVDFRFLYMLNDCLKGFFFHFFLIWSKKEKTKNFTFIILNNLHLKHFNVTFK